MAKQRSEKGEAPVIGPTEASVKTTQAIKQEELSMANSTEMEIITPETMPTITWDGARVITTELLARLYGASPKQIHDGFQYHQSRFEVGKHFFRLEKDQLREFRDYPGNSGVVAPRTRQLIVWTERGAARHAKMLETEAAWEVFERLEDCYFTVKEVLARAAYAVHPGQTLSAEQADTLRFMLTENVKKLPKEKQAGAMVKGWSKLKAHFKTDYRHIPAGEFHEAVSILARHVAEWELVDERPKERTLNETVAHLTKHVESSNGAPASIFLPLVNAVHKKLGRARLVQLRPGQVVVDSDKLASVWVDLGKLKSRIDGLCASNEDLPPSWWERNAIAGA